MEVWYKGLKEGRESVFGRAKIAQAIHTLSTLTYIPIFLLRRLCRKCFPQKEENIARPERDREERLLLNEDVISLHVFVIVDSMVSEWGIMIRRMRVY